MIYVKSILVGIAMLLASAGTLLYFAFTLHWHSLGWGGYINVDPLALIPLLFFAAGYYWEFRRTAKKSA